MANEPNYFQKYCDNTVFSATTLASAVATGSLIGSAMAYASGENIVEYAKNGAYWGGLTLAGHLGLTLIFSPFLFTYLLASIWGSSKTDSEDSSLINDAPLLALWLTPWLPGFYAAEYVCSHQE